MEASWATPGMDVICIREKWLRPAGLIGFLMGAYEERTPAPKFMQQYKIAAIKYYEPDDEGHRVKLIFAEFGDAPWCVCGFRPLEKLKGEKRKRTTAPVTPELIDG